MLALPDNLGESLMGIRGRCVGGKTSSKSLWESFPEKRKIQFQNNLDLKKVPYKHTVECLNLGRSILALGVLLLLTTSVFPLQQVFV